MGSVDLRPPSGETYPAWEYISNLGLVYHCISILEIAVCKAGFCCCFVLGEGALPYPTLLASDMRSTSY